MGYVLYDDDCGFCSNLAKKTSSLIEGSVICFLSFTSVKGKELISNYKIEDINSVIYIDHRDKVFLKADAVLNICKFMNFPYNLFSIFNLLPNVFLNLVYNFISRNRMKL